MSIRILGIVVASVVLFSGCATTSTGEQDTAVADAAASTKDAPAAETVAAVDPEDEVICKKVVKTGSRFSETICAPRRAWDKSSDRGEKSTEELQRKPIWDDD